MMMSVTFSLKSSPSTLNTIIYVLNGWECRVQHEIELFNDNFVQAVLADPWRYDYYYYQMEEYTDAHRQSGTEPPSTEVVRFFICLHVLMKKPDQGFYLSIRFLGLDGNIPVTEYSLDISSSLNYVPQSLQVSNFNVYFATTDKLFKLDFLAGTSFTTIDMTQVIQTAISDSHRFAIEFISNVLQVKIIDSTNTMRLNLQLNHALASTPVVRIGKSVEAGSLVMCTHEANSSMNNVYFDQISLNGDTVSFSTANWAQCLAAIGPTSTNSNALFLLMYPDLTVKSVKITFSSGIVRTKSSAAALSNFLSFDPTSTTAYGILFHQEQFIFGVTNYIYDQALTGNAGFLTSLENYRLTQFYTADYSSDSGITPNGASTTQVQANESITDGSVTRDETYAQYRLYSIYLDRNEYIKTTCHMGVVTDYKYCSLDTQSWEQRCFWEAVDLSKYEYKYNDVCFPFWLKDELIKDDYGSVNLVYEENGNLKPTALQAFSLVLNGVTQQSRQNGNPLEGIGKSRWVSIQLNDRRTFTTYNLILFNNENTLFTKNSAVMGISETFPLVNFEFLNEQQQLEFQLAGCWSPMMIQLPGETCVTEETLSDDTLVGDVPWGEIRKMYPNCYPGDYEIQFPLGQRNLIGDLRSAHFSFFDFTCSLPLPERNHHSDWREVMTEDVQTKSVYIEGEGTKDWGCFAAYIQICTFYTDHGSKFETWTSFTFSNPLIQVAVSEEEAAVININKPWAEFYMDNLGTVRWIMDPPSIEQILSSDLEESKISILMSRLYPDYKLVEETQSPNDDNEAPSNVFLTEDQINEARSQAQYRMDNDEYQRSEPVNLQYDINSAGVLKFLFSRSVILPKYMVDLVNEANEDPYQDQTTKPDQTVVEENIVNQSTVAEPLAEQQQTEKQGVIAEPLVDESTADQDGLADMNGGNRRRNLSVTKALLTQLPDMSDFWSQLEVIFQNSLSDEQNALMVGEALTTSGWVDDQKESFLEIQAQQCQEGFYYDNETELCINENPSEPEVVVEEQQEEILEWYLNTLDFYVNIHILGSNRKKNVRWSITEASHNGFNLQISQEDLDSIQQGDELIINLEGLDKLDGGLPKSSPPIVIDLSLFVPVIEEERQQSTAQEAATQMLLLTTVIKVVTKGSLHELWGAINGMQLAANQPIINIEIAKNASEFSASIAGIVTFDIPGLNMEFVFGWCGMEMPEEDPILMDIDEEAVSDETEIDGVPWSEFKITFMHDPCWARKDCGQSLSDEKRIILTRLIDAQEEFGWELHDQRRIGYNRTWKDLKEQAMDSQFREKTWFAELSDSQVALVENLRSAQVRQGDMNELQLQPNPLQETKGSSAYFIGGLDLLAFANAYLSRTLGTAFLWILVTTVGLVMLLVLSPFGRFQFAQKAIDYLKKKLLWNVVLRTVMQTSLEFGFCIVFTLKYAEFDGSIGAAINFCYAYLFTILLGVIPFFFIIFYKKNNETFREIKYERLAGVDEIGNQLEFNEVAFSTCSKFYQDGSMKAVIKKIMQGDVNEFLVEITPLEKDQLEFLQSLQSLRYIHDADIIRETIPHKAILELNGNFQRNFKADMKREIVKQEFMDRYGDPLGGFDLEKSIVIWFPAYFIMVRVVFVAGALLLWRYPMPLLLLRLFTSLLGFIIVVNIQPYDNVKANKLELMNEATVILIIDCIIFCTDILNTGNENDLNAGNTPDLQTSRQFIGMVYIIVFSGNITVHMSLLGYNQIRTMIRSCKKKIAMWNNKISRERIFQKKNNDDLQQHRIKKRSFCTGMCLRVCGTKKLYEKVVIEDVKLGIRSREEDDFDNLELMNIKEEVKGDGDTEKTVLKIDMTMFQNDQQSNIQDYNSKDEETNIKETQRKLMENFGKQFRQKTNISLPIKPQDALGVAWQPELGQIESTAWMQKSYVQLEHDPYTLAASHYHADPDQIDGTKTEVVLRTKVFTIAHKLMNNMKSKTKAVDKEDLTTEQREEKQLQKTVSMFNIDV